MARKYEVLACPECGTGVRIDPTEGGTEGFCLSCGWSERGDFDNRRDIRKPLSVTAIDERDLGPLLTAIRPLAATAKRTSPEGNPYSMVPANQLRALDAALKAFEAEEDSGG
jgi:hypothetical protein